MVLKYNIIIQKENLQKNLKRLINQIYKLLPMREEGGDWQKPLETIIEEFAGMNRLILSDYDHVIFSLLCKLEGLFTLQKDEEFGLYRRVIFECLSIIGDLIKACQD